MSLGAVVELEALLIYWSCVMARRAMMVWTWECMLTCRVRLVKGSPFGILTSRFAAVAKRLNYRQGRSKLGDFD